MEIVGARKRDCKIAEIDKKGGEDRCRKRGDRP